MLRSSLGRLALSAVLASGVFGVGVTGPARASTGAQPTLIGSTAKCQDVVFIGAEGSGETYADNQGLGPEVRGALDAYASHLDGYSIGFFPVPYPSAPADVWSLALTDYSSTFFQSIDSGVKETLTFLAARSQCKDEHYVLAGYSQGAMAMHRALAQLTSPSKQNAALAVSVLPRVDGVLALADGDRVENQGGGSYGTAAPGYGITWPFQGVSSARYKPMSGPIPSTAAWPASRFLSVCDAGDLVCDFGHAVPLPTAFKPAIWQAVQTTAQVNDGIAIHSADYRPAGSGSVFVASAAASVARTTRELQPKLPPTPQQLHFIKSMAVSMDHSLALANNGLVYSWGSNGSGELGLGTTMAAATPQWVTGLDGVSSVAVGGASSYAIRSDGSLWSWGNNDYSQLGTGVAGNAPSPARVPGLPAARSLTTDLYEANAILTGMDGSVWVWGQNSWGELGVGSRGSNVVAPTKLQIPVPVQEVVSNYWTTYAIGTDGSVWAWGDNSSSQLGDGTRNNAMTPQPVPGVDSVKQLVSGGYMTTYALRTDGSVVQWGGGTTPHAVNTSAPIAQLAAGGDVVFARTATGRLLAWGNGTCGSLGIGQDGVVATPTQVGGGVAQGLVTSVATNANGTAAFAVLSNGSVWAWGAGGDGEMGNGTAAACTSTPVKVNGLNVATQIFTAQGAFGNSAAIFAVGSDGSVWSWGLNYGSNLGQGYMVGNVALSPVRI